METRDVNASRRSAMAAIVVSLTVLSSLALSPAPAEATFPGANGKIAFYYYFPRHAKESISSINPDGSGLQRLTLPTQHNREFPVWSPDGSMIAYSVSRSAGPSINVMSASGTNRTTVLRRPPSGHRRFISNVDWSPSRTKLVFSSNGSKGSAVFKVNVDGSGLQQITTGKHNDFGGVWAPDGSKIALVTYFQSGFRLILVNPDGTQRVSILQMPYITFLSWSPDSTKILFCRSRHHHLDIYVVNADGTGLTRLTHTARRTEYGPVFSPDGTQIAFSRSQGLDVLSPDNLWVMDADGSNAHRITTTKRRDEFLPSWQAV